MDILGLSLWKGKYKEFIEILKHPTSPISVFTPNPEILVIAHDDSHFYNSLARASYLVPDGNWLYVAEEMKKNKNFLKSASFVYANKKEIEEVHGELIKGSDLTRDLCEYANHTKTAILVIDNYRITEPKNPFEIQKQKTQSLYSDLLKKQFPNARSFVLFDWEKTPEEIANYIQENSIRYVFSCIGMKKQEERILQIFEFLPKNYPVVGLWVGASVDFLLGLQKRAPEFIRNGGVEWLYRLALEPRKRWKRIKRATIEFPNLIKTQYDRE